MEPTTIKARLQSAFLNAEVEVTGAGCQLEARIISPEFKQLNAVQRQQKVLAVVKDAIQSGALHAFNVKALTPEEWQESGG